MERVCEKHYSRVISCRGIRKNGIGERASEYWEWGLGGKILVEVYNKNRFFSDASLINMQEYI